MDGKLYQEKGDFPHALTKLLRKWELVAWAESK
jgi:hypothetical protein